VDAKLLLDRPVAELDEQDLPPLVPALRAPAGRKQEHGQMHSKNSMLDQGRMPNNYGYPSISRNTASASEISKPFSIWKAKRNIRAGWIYQVGTFNCQFSLSHQKRSGLLELQKIYPLVFAVQKNTEYQRLKSWWETEIVPFAASLKPVLHSEREGVAYPETMPSKSE
jgi:hypothetical protein